ncbi:GNAT family N-acetyltransferase [Aliikangiella maris]|uniref:GNAT family N-acetyltransferase n=2 Tax=Aliikangiella maris TaxID=3162458 RepID=A0ABV2BZJ4_9GAMM
MLDYQLKFPDLSQALYRALSKDAFYVTLQESIEGDAKQKKQAMLAYMDFSISEAQKYGACYIPKNQHYGVSVWSKPIPDELSEQKKVEKISFIHEFLGQAAQQVYSDICNNMSDNAQPLVAKSDWYLSIIGILPDYQGQGLGPGLIENILQQTDKAGIATYLETFTKRNLTFYFRLGYQTVGDFFEPVTKAQYWLLRRQPL